MEKIRRGTITYLDTDLTKIDILIGGYIIKWEAATYFQEKCYIIIFFHINMLYSNFDDRSVEAILTFVDQTNFF